MMDNDRPAPTPNRRRELAAASVDNTVKLLHWLIVASLAASFAAALFPSNSVAGNGDQARRPRDREGYPA